METGKSCLFDSAPACPIISILPNPIVVGRVRANSTVLEFLCVNSALMTVVVGCVKNALPDRRGNASH